MGRTTTAAAASFGIALVAVAGVGWLLGFGLVASLVAGAILGAAAAALLVGASRRAAGGTPPGQPRDPIQPTPGEPPPPPPKPDDERPDPQGTP